MSALWRVTETEAWIATRLVEQMRDEANSWLPLESGGLLMGYWSQHDAVVITEVVGPGPMAHHETDGFAPDYDYHEDKVAEIYSGSEGLATYLGDWHSHPGGGTRLSRKDRRLLAAISRHDESRTPEPLMAVLGRQPDWTLDIWVRRRVGPIRLTRTCELHVHTTRAIATTSHDPG